LQPASNEIVITAVDPLQMLGVLVEDPDMKAAAVEVKTKLEKVISSLEWLRYFSTK
jgi:hypothetical protein